MLDALLVSYTFVLLSMLSFPGHAEEAQLPYFDLIPSDPTLEEVWKLVCVEQRRPSLPNTWSQHEVWEIRTI